jgi:hypothetical protein
MDYIHCKSVLRIWSRIQIRRIRIFWGLPDPLVRDTDSDPSIKQI